MRKIFTVSAVIVSLFPFSSAIADTANPVRSKDTEMCKASDDVSKSFCVMSKFYEAEAAQGRTWVMTKTSVRVEGVTRRDCAKYARLDAGAQVNGVAVASYKGDISTVCRLPKNTIAYPYDATSRSR